MKYIKLLLATLVVLAATIPVPLAHAQGGLEHRPYWAYRTEAPVVDVQTGDINGDGVPEVVIVTNDGVVYVLENDGDLAWRYETGSVTATAGLLVDDLDGDGHAAEIIVYGENAIMLSDSERLVWTWLKGPNWTWRNYDFRRVIASDLNGDGRPEGVAAIYDAIWITDPTIGSNIGGRAFARPVADVWAGDIDGDGRPEIVTSLVGGRDVYVLEAGKRPAWTQHIESEIGLVQGGDVDGDGQAEVVVLSTAWDLFLLESDGGQVWHDESLSVGNAPSAPVPDQFIVHDLDGDGRAEILVVTPAPSAAVNVFDGDGVQIWVHPLEAVSSPTRLTARDVNGDGQAEVVVTTEGQERAYLLSSTGKRLAEYRTWQTSGAIDYADLNHDGWGEIIVGTETGVQVFGASDQVVWGELWPSRRLGERVTALYIGDLDGDGRGEVAAGSDDGQVYVLTDEGHVLWEVDLEEFVFGLSAGDVDGDGRREVIVGTGVFVGVGRGHLHLLDGERRSWVVPIGGEFINSLAAHDLDGDDRAEIIAGSEGGSGGLVEVRDGGGALIWGREFDQAVTAVDGGPGDGRGILVGTESGGVYHLAADGSPLVEYDLGAKVLSFGEGAAVTSDGRVYWLDESGPSMVRELEGDLKRVQLVGDSMAMLEGRWVSLLAGNGSIWQGSVEGGGISLAAGDLQGNGEVQVAVGTDQGRVHLLGLALDQPLMLTGPDLAETRTGYAYSVDVNDPEENGVPITLEIWDPSAGVWVSHPALSLGEGQDRGRLTWDVTQPFDTWDSGQESRFRFSYADGGQQTTTQQIPGPFTIPTLPWYVYYGQRAGLAALILLVPALGLLLYRRQRAYRLSPVGRAEATLKQLQADPSDALVHVHDLTRDDPAQLTHLPGLAREAGEMAIADLGEGFHLILTRPEVADEGLRAILGAIKSPNGSQGERTMAMASLYDLFKRMLEANTVSRIVALRPQMGQVEKTLAGTDCDLAEVPGALADLGQVAQALRNYQRVELVEDKIAYLGQAIESLGRLGREFQGKLPQPERNILIRIAANWLIVANNALQDLQGRAQLEISLKTHQLVDLEGAILSLELTNTGRSPASNVVVELLPGQGYAARDGETTHLDILPASRSEVVELPVSAAPSAEQFRPEFRVTFDDRERSGKTQTFADLVHLMRPAAEFQPIRNPYAPGTPLSTGSPIFYGRDDLFEFIAENMAGLARQNVLVLIGQRRMGKTSFLQQLPARLGDEYLPVYTDGQSLGVDPGMANFFYDLALTIGDSLADQGIDLPEPKVEDFQERPSGAFERGFLPAVFEAIGLRQLLLLFDEFEELEMRVESGKLDPTIFPFFRHLMQHGGDLGFIFVGTHRLEALSSDYWSIFFNIALYKHVAFLSQEAAQALIVEPVAEYGLRYDDLAVDKMLRVTACHPYFLQLICHALVNHANRERRGYLTIQDVNDILEEMLELGEAHFAFLWEQSGSQERLVLASMTRLLSREPTVTASQVAELLAERGAAMEVEQITEALRRLVERDVVREVGGQPPRYEYKVELVRLWMERYKALGKVMEEVG